MSHTLKGIIIVLAILMVAGFYLLEQDRARYQAELSPHQGLQNAVTTGRVEVKSFQAWCQAQGHQGDALENCVQKREAKAKLLLELEKKAQESQEPKEEQSDSSETTGIKN